MTLGKLKTQNLQFFYSSSGLFRFGLFEAMSAIEMMDPKMDAGMVCNQSKRKFVDLKHGIEVWKVSCTHISGNFHLFVDRIYKNQRLFSSRTAWNNGRHLCLSSELGLFKFIHDMMCNISFQVTWLEGHSLAQTVFTNLYLHEPSLIEDRMLKAFSISMLKIVDIIRDRINKASVFEEVRFLCQLNSS
jgi:hypothetical protein